MARVVGGRGHGRNVPLAAVGLGVDPGSSRVISELDRFDEELMRLAALLRQLEAWRESWQSVRCRPGAQLSPEFVRESQRLARRLDEVLA